MRQKVKNDMKDIELVIKIPEEMYKWAKDANKSFDDYGTSDFVDLVKNGTPIDEIRAEIEQEKIGYPPSADYRIAIMKCLQIIDKYEAESEVEDVIG